MNYKLIRSPKRRKSISLRVSKNGEVIVRSPIFTPKFVIDKFVTSKKDWIIMQQQGSKKLLNKLNEKEFLIYKKKLLEYLSANLDAFAAKIGVDYTSYAVKNVTSYWGNCTSDNKLNFNASLAKFENHLIDYVIIHELCHVRYRGHGKRFWNLVSKHYPDYKAARKTLNQIPID